MKKALRKLLHPRNLSRAFSRAAIAYAFTYIVMAAVIFTVAPKWFGMSIVTAGLVGALYKISGTVAALVASWTSVEALFEEGETQ